MKKNTKIIIAAVIGLVLLTGVVVMSLNGRDTQETAKTEDVFENEPTIAPVDSSVTVTFKEGAKKGEAVLRVENAPKGTKEIEYEIVYDAIPSNPDEGAGDTPVSQGASGRCVEEGDTWECGEPAPGAGRKIVFGTCSSGVCRYHKITSQIDVRLMFTGSYGERVFEKKYSL